ncbi:THAP domain-containing protein 3-like [Dermacentor variabilis]|uniref:THAP domain-containing protein 3-like n=1 Tax=Dermacentor variabilis TaxID=34621 RepID=UPI003F5CA04C
MPRTYCVVDFCETYSGLGITMHRFPHDILHWQKWTEFVRATGRLEWTPLKHSRICSLHFERACYKENPLDFTQSNFPSRLRKLKPGAVPTIHAALCPAPLPKRPRRQSCSDTELELAAPHRVSMDLKADYEINEAANASGQVKLDAQSQCFIEVCSKATQAALKATTKSVKLHASRTVKEVACQSDLELPDILLMEEMCQRCPTTLCSEPSMTYEDNTYDKT